MQAAICLVQQGKYMNFLSFTSKARLSKHGTPADLCPLLTFVPPDLCSPLSDMHLLFCSEYVDMLCVTPSADFAMLLVNPPKPYTPILNMFEVNTTCQAFSCLDNLLSAAREAAVGERVWQTCCAVPACLPEGVWSQSSPGCDE